MQRETEIELLEAALAMVLEKRRPIDGEETLTPVSEYADPARFDREMDRVFRRQLNVVTLTSRVVAPGDFITADVVGVPVIVSRGEDGHLRAFLNVCRHRGATVERRAEGRCKRFVCPYHAWTYNTDGSLHRARHPEGFPTLVPKENGLVELPCVEAAGLVFVCPSPDATPAPLPAAFVAELETMLGPRPVACASSVKTWKANWKLIVEGGIESYHFSVAHKDTIARFFGDTQSLWARMGWHMRSVLPKRSITQLAERPQDEWHIRDHTHIVYTLHPNAMILLQKTHFDLIRMTPIAVDRTEIEVTTVGTAPEDGNLSDRARAFMAENHAFSMRTLDEDFEIGEQIQRGLATGANTHFRFARFEGALTDWRQRLDALVA